MYLLCGWKKIGVGKIKKKEMVGICEHIILQKRKYRKIEIEKSLTKQKTSVVMLREDIGLENREK